MWCSPSHGCSSHAAATDVHHCSALGWHVRMAPPAIESWQGPLGLARSSCIEMRCPAAFTCRNNSVGNRSGSSAICPGCPGFAPPYRPTHTHRDLGKFRMDQVEGTESLFGLSAAIHMLGKEAPDGFLEVHRDVADRSHSIVTVISDEAVLPRRTSARPWMNRSGGSDLRAKRCAKTFSASRPTPVVAAVRMLQKETR